jgi:DNA-binding XRE family transcriptional regulator
MEAKDFKEWRERFNLTQEDVAQRFRVSRTTVQNWESGANPITQAVEMGCQVWAPRLKQEDHDLGPLTLIYTDGPMFVDPYGAPPRQPAMIRQESHPTNAAAVTRVQKLWGRAGFCDPMIIEKTREPLWNAVELKRVVEGIDTGAPTLSNLLRRIAEDVKSTSTTFVWAEKGPNPAERKERQQQIEALATQLQTLAATVLDDEAGRRKVEEVFLKLRGLGKRPRDSLVNGVAHAFVAAEQMTLRDFRLSQGQGDNSFVVVLADDGRTRVITRIAREAIDDHLQARELSHRQRIAFAERNLPQIARIIAKKYEAQDYTIYTDRFGITDENNKLIILTSDDFDGPGLR